jgi:transcription termination factor NusA
MDALDVDEMMAQLLVAEGFTNLEEVAYVELDELLSIDGFDEGTAAELQARARDYLEAANAKAMENARAMGVEDSLVNFEGLTPADAGSAGPGRHQDAGRLRHLRRLGTGGRLDDREWSAQEGRRRPGKIRHVAWRKRRP